MRTTRFLCILLLTAVPAWTQTVDDYASGFADQGGGVVGEVLAFLCVADIRMPIDGAEPQVEIGEIQAPQGLEVQYLDGGIFSAGQSVFSINGVSSGHRSFKMRHTWQVKAKAVGTYKMPGIKFKVEGKEYQTSPSTIVITKEAPGNRWVTVDVVVSNSTPYVNEAIRIRYLLTSQRSLVAARGSQPRLLVPWAGSPNGFLAMPLTKPNRQMGEASSHIVLNDKKTLIAVEVKRDRNPPVIELSFDKVLYALAPGRIDMGSTTTRLEVAQSVRRGGIMRDNQYVGREKALVLTEPLIIDVKDAPLSGRPKSYRGAIGELEVALKFGSGKIRAGDGVTLTLNIRGGDFLELLETPKIDADFPNCQVLPSGRHLAGEAGQRSLTFSWLIKPLRDDVTSLPVFEYSWFNPKTEVFVTANTGPLTLEIEGEISEAEVFSRSSGRPDRIDLAEIGEGIRSLKDDPGSWQETEGHAPWFWLAVITGIPLLSFFLLQSLARRQQRLADDTGRHRRKRASREATARLVEAQAFLGQKGFYGKLARSLAGFIADKIALPAASVSAATVSGLFAERGLDHQRSAEVAKLLDDLDAREFGGSRDDDAQHRELLRHVEDLIASLDKEIKA